MCAPAANIAGAGGLVLLVILLLYKELFFVAFDPVMAEASGLPVGLLQYLLLAMIGVTVVVAPTLRIGSSAHHLPFGGTMSLPTETYYRVIRAGVESLVTPDAIALPLAPLPPLSYTAVSGTEDSAPLGSDTSADPVDGVAGQSRWILPSCPAAQHGFSQVGRRLTPRGRRPGPDVPALNRPSVRDSACAGGDPGGARQTSKHHRVGGAPCAP